MGLVPIVVIGIYFIKRLRADGVSYGRMLGISVLALSIIMSVLAALPSSALPVIYGIAIGIGGLSVLAIEARRRGIL